MAVLGWSGTTNSVTLTHFLTPANLLNLSTKRPASASPAPGDTVAINGVTNPLINSEQGTILFPSGAWTAVDFYGLQDQTLLVTNPNAIGGDTVQQVTAYVNGTAAGVQGATQLKLENSHLLNDRFTTTGTNVMVSYLDSVFSGSLLVRSGAAPGLFQVQVVPADTAGQQPDDHIPATTFDATIDIASDSVFWVTSLAAGGFINNGPILVRPGGALVFEDSSDANALTNPFFVPYNTSHDLVLGNGGAIDVEGAAGKTTKAAILVNTAGSGTITLNGNGADPGATSMIVDGNMQGQTIVLADGTITFQDATTAIDTPASIAGFDVTGGSFTFADDKGVLVLHQAPLTTLRIGTAPNGSTVSQQTSDGRTPFTTPISGFRSGDVIKLPGKDLAAFSSSNTYTTSYDTSTHVLSILSPSTLAGYPPQILAQLTFTGAYDPAGFHLAGNPATQELDLTYSGSSAVSLPGVSVSSLPAAGAMVTNATLNGTVQAAAAVNLSAAPVVLEVDGNSTLQTLLLSYGVELDIGFAAAGTLTGAGSIAPAGGSGPNTPLVDNFGTLDVNGRIGTRLDNDGQLTVSAGERLDVAGDLMSMGAISVAANGELDLDSPTASYVNQATLAGRLRTATALATLHSAANTGTIDVAAGTLALASSMTGSGAIVVESGAKLDMSAAGSVSNTIALAPGATLAVGLGTSFTGTVQAPVSGATIELVGLGASSATVSNGAIVITTGSGTISLAETGLAEGAAFGIGADGAGGSLISLTPGSTGAGGGAGTSTPGGVLPVYRFFDRLHGTHFFTSDIGERNATAALTSAFAEETNGFGAVASSDPAATAVYRFFDTKFGTHFFTASASERDSVAAARPDLVFEAASTFYEHKTQQAGDVAVYRFFDQTSGTHFYTGDQSEYNAITTPGAAGYRADLKLEGVEFYAPAGTFT